MTMSDVQRFSLVSGHHVLPDKEGRFVEYVDYKRMAARVEVLGTAAQEEAAAWRRTAEAQRKLIDALDDALITAERKLASDEGPQPDPEAWELGRIEGHYEPTVEDVEEAHRLWQADHEAQQLILRPTYRRRRWWQFWRT